MNKVLFLFSEISIPYSDASLVPRYASDFPLKLTKFATVANFGNFQNNTLSFGMRHTKVRQAFFKESPAGIAKFVTAQEILSSGRKS